MSRIDSCFAILNENGRKALIPFVTAGFPDPGMTLPIMHSLVAGGADIIELGVPFSDPMADGPTIQRASEKALSYGVSLRVVLGMVREFRKDNNLTPIVLMGYANPIEAYGFADFARDAREVGVDGVLVVDYPPEECSEFSATIKHEGLASIFLLAPTSTDRRFAEVSRAGSGYIYYVSLKGVTGAAHVDLAEVVARIPLIRQRTGLPVGVGFGIRDGISAAKVAAVADAVVIGSRIIEEIESSARADVPDRVMTFLKGIRIAMDTGGSA